MSYKYTSVSKSQPPRLCKNNTKEQFFIPHLWFKYKMEASLSISLKASISGDYKVNMIVNFFLLLRKRGKKHQANLMFTYFNTGDFLKCVCEGRS